MTSESEHDRADPVVHGDRLGLPVPADAPALLAAGPAFLTRAFRAWGAMDETVRVAEILASRAVDAGGTGAKLCLDLRYDGAGQRPPSALFVKFSRNFDDPIRDRTRFHMAPEIRFAALARVPGFPVTVPRSQYADFHAESGTGILITERIGYGQGGIEPQYPKCLDEQLPDPEAHYRLLLETIARLSGSHRAGTLPDSVDREFPFDRAAVLAADRLPDAESLARKIARLKAFAHDCPQLFADADFSSAALDRFEAEAQRFLRQEMAIKRFLHDDPDLLALCHWNANIDNAWFWREADGRLACGLIDWGSVGTMNLGMSLWGCLSGARTPMWTARLDSWLDLYVDAFRAAGGPAIDSRRLRQHLLLYAAMMGLAYLLDAPARIRKEVPECTRVSGPLDARFMASETARTQRLMLTNLVNLWQREALADCLDLTVGH